jgi:DNA ligase 1
MNELERLSQLVESLRKESSALTKKNILKNYEDLKPLLKIIYDPLYILNITGNNLKKFYNEDGNICSNKPYENIFDLLKDLHTRKITGNEALLESLCFFNMFCMDVEFDLFCDILNKDLKCGISVKTINSVFKNLIPEFNVPLANEYREGLCDFEKEEWFVSRKLDGVRCLCFISYIDNKINVEFFSRNGIRFETLDNLKISIISSVTSKDSVILDGEICIVDENGNENFQNVMTEIRRKNHTIKNPKFFVFDCYSLESFKKGAIENFEVNLDLNDFTNGMEWLRQTEIKNKEHLLELVKNIDPKWEGLMLRKYPTQFKRSNNLLKIKKFKEKDFEVLATISSKKVIDGENKVCIGSLIIEYKGNRIQVGSGLTDKERLDWLKEPEKIVGKIITVKYFEETKNQNGDWSLRFPIFKGIRDYE